MPNLSKVLVAIMAEQVYSHFERILTTTSSNWREFKRLLTNKQHGYRSKMSCTTNIMQLFDTILHDSQMGFENGLTMCDLSAAFDTVPHTILLEKLKLYGFSEDTINWFRSYLPGRSQYVDINGGKYLRTFQ